MPTVNKSRYDLARSFTIETSGYKVNGSKTIALWDP